MQYKSDINKDTTYVAIKWTDFSVMLLWFLFTRGIYMPRTKLEILLPDIVLQLIYQYPDLRGHAAAMPLVSRSPIVFYKPKTNLSNKWTDAYFLSYVEVIYLKTDSILDMFSVFIVHSCSP